MSKTKRLENLLIEGEEVVELDYGQMAPRLLYGMAGIEPPLSDAYLVANADQARVTDQLISGADRVG